MTPNIFPVMRYADARAAIAWLGRAFGFEQVAEHGAGDRIDHTELRLGDGLIALASATAAIDGNPWSSVRQGIYVCVDDVDAHFRRAQTAGADIVSAPRDMDYGSREYDVRDCGGFLWGFGTYGMSAAEGRPNIFPELHYDDPSAIDWLARAFGFRPTAQIPGPDGQVFHAEMRLGAGAIMLGLGKEDHGVRQACSVRVDDPDAHHARALAAGAQITLPPFTTHYGARSYWARDLEGFAWGFSTYEPES